MTIERLTLSSFTVYPFGWRERSDLQARLRDLFTRMERRGVYAHISRHPVTSVLMARLPAPCSDIVLVNGEHLSADRTIQVLDAITLLMNQRARKKA